MPDGGLWVGYWFGGVSLIKDGKVSNYGEREGLPSRAVLAFARDRRGTIWIAAGRDGLARLEGTHWKKIGADWGFTESANTVFVDRSGTVWVGTTSQVEYLTEGATRFQMAADNLKIVMRFSEAPDGTLWMAETNRGVRPVPLPWRKNSNQAPEIVAGSQAITFDDKGSLWIASLGDGIIRIPYPERQGPAKLKKSDTRLERLTHQADLSADYVYCVLQDREGNIWFGTNGGVDQYRQSPIVSFRLSVDASVSALVPGDTGSLWVTSVGPAYIAQLRSDAATFQLMGPYIDCAYRDPDGVIWLAAPDFIARLDDKRLGPTDSNSKRVAYRYHSGISVWSYRENVALRKLVKVRQLDLPTQSGVTVNSQSRVKAMTSDASGRLWISMQSGTFRLEESGWSSLESLGGPGGTAKSAFRDSEGRIWFGFIGTVAMLEANKVTVFSGADGVRVGAVTSIQEEGSRIWIGGESGLQYFAGNRFQSVESADSGTLDGISGIIADTGKGLWLATGKGVTLIAEPELQGLNVSNHKVVLRTFGLLDGLTAAVHADLASPLIARTSDGRIWFATTKGLVWIDPNRILSNPVPPRVVIESLVANGRQYNASTTLKLPARTKSLQIVYTATSLTIPERVRFRYKLDGQDKEWQEPGTRREAVYTNLDPGSYSFHVVACNNDGVWNEAGASFGFSIAPAYYQTNWFRALYVVVFLALLWVAYQARVRQLRNEEKKFREAVETMPASAFIAMPNGQRTFVNSRWMEYTGLTEERALGWGWEAAVHPDDLRRVLKTWQESPASGNALEYEERLRRGSDGAYRWFQTRAVPVRDKRGKIVKWYGVINDIEDRKRAEQLQADLAHVNRVSTMGELTASLAHEIKQPIGAAVTNAEACARLLDRDQPDVPEAREAALEMAKDARRAAHIIDRVRSLYRKGSSQIDTLDVTEVVGEMLLLLHNEANRHSVSMRTDLGDGLPRVRADRVQLQQVLMNLMLNGIQAMAETGGVLTIKARLDHDGRVLISVSDTGVGLPAEKAEQIFEAFFSTKPEGSGMGLAISRSIIESHGGRVWATANSGKGASFHFTLLTAA
jgi:PAS domain S-box-containing protein